MRKRLVELIEECRDACLQSHIPLTSERIAEHLIEKGIVEVVRCENCSWYKRENKYSGQCKLHRLDTTNDFYCELGRRKKIEEQIERFIEISPPYNVFDTMYTIDGNQLKEWKVQFIGYDYSNGKFEMHLATENYEEVIVVRDFELHKTVFPTLEEAENALAERSKL